ncbi:MAG: hypothetical protein GY742_09640 [Hyphomicrobiales bacterium]|nr:hypothetical protein [Hyphomicrobiales bacterium]
MHPRSKPKEIAVVVHLHYNNLWPEFAEKLPDFPVDFDLLVTITKQNELLAEQIERQFAGATVEKIGNKGRDI